VRRSLYPAGGIETISGLGEFSNPVILLLLAASALVFLALSMLIFWFADRMARKAGKVDMTTTY